MTDSDRSVDYSTLLLRWSLAAVFIAHALLKLFVFTLPGAAHFFASVGLPGWLAYAVTALELAGSVLLIVGRYVPWAALALAVDALGALVFVHAQNGWLFTDAGGGWEYPAFLALVSLAVFLKTLPQKLPRTVVVHS